ncbi:MAG: hypothetical protein ACRDN0_12625 [Trebonia sp.]
MRTKDELDKLREQARELRLQGLRYKDIAARLHVSLSSVSLWVRDLPTPPRFLPEENKKRAVEGHRRYWEKERRIREDQRSSDMATAAAEIGDLTDRELLIAGAIAYWCEGAKPRPHERIAFVNSDPGLISLFLRFLDTVGVSQEDVTFGVQIHETADVEAAERYWRETAGATADQFTKTTLKRHNPKTNRKNTGESYHGCLRVSVRHGSALYRKIAGWAAAAMSAV